MNDNYLGNPYNAKIIIKNLPELQYKDNFCFRVYSYQFVYPLPKQDKLKNIAKKMHKTFFLDKEEYKLGKDIEVSLSIEINRVANYRANVSVITNIPEESCVFVYGERTTPKMIEKELGTIFSIQNQPRENWL